MVLAEEYLLKADNYASAAMMVGADEGRALIRLAAIWRNRALRIRLGSRARDYLKSRPVPENAVRW